MSEEREARDAFEAWAFEKRRYRRGAVKGGGYVSPPANGAWEGWKAALEWQAARHTPHLSNLLARIHRDGGHYEAEHGTEKAVAEAEKRIAELNAGATWQEPVAWYTDDHLSDKSATTWDRNVAERWRAKGWPVGALCYAPIGDNGAKVAMTTPSIAVDPSAPALTLAPIAQPAESKRMITDADIRVAASRKAIEYRDEDKNGMVIGYSWRFTEDDLLELVREMLARAQAKGE